MNFVLALIAFNFIVLIHEIGHYTVARLAKVKILEFSLFFGPRIFSIPWGETVYSLRLIPAGGYVRLEGEEGESSSADAFNKKPLLTRSAVILAGPFINLLIAVILLSVVFSFTGYSTTKTNSVQKNSPAYVSGIRPGDTILSYDNKRVYQPMDMLSFMYVTKGKPSPAVILRDNRKINTVITPELIPAQNRYILGFTPVEIDGRNSNVVKEADTAVTGDKSRLMPGDRIVGLNGTVVANRKEIADYMATNREKTLNVTVLRNGTEVVLSITPKPLKSPEQYYIGMDFVTGRGNIITIIGQSVTYAYSTVRSVVYTVYWIITGKVGLGETMGPVGIFTTISDVVQQSPTVSLVILNLLNITAFISIALGVSNLLPIPIADGGKMLLIVVEGIRGKPIPVEKEAFITMVSFVLMIVLSIFITYNDILRLFTGR